MRTSSALVLLVTVSACGIVGCRSSSSSSPALGESRVALHRAKGCADLLEDLKADARTKLDRVLDRAVDDIHRCQAATRDDQCAYYGYGYATPKGAAEGAPVPSGDTTGGATNGAGSYSQTNVQVQGVDEADIVKNDGNNLYVLHGRAFEIVKAWPATDLAVTASLDIEGAPSSMFVDDGRAVVYSTVNGAGVFQAAGVTPKHGYQELGWYGWPYGGGGVDAAPGAAMPAPGGDTTTGGTYAPLTKITVLDLTSGTPTVAREVYFEGSYLSARRVGTHVRTVLQSYAYGPKLAGSTYELATATGESPQTVAASPTTGTEAIAQLEKLRAYNRGVIDGSQLADWLPYTFVKNGAAVTAKTVACEDFYVPTAGSTESGMTEVSAIDLANPVAEPRATAILGRADTVYANAGKMVLAAHAWVEPPVVAWSSSGSGSTGSGSAGSGTVTSPPATTPAPAPAPAPAPQPAQIGTRALRPLAGGESFGLTAVVQNKTHLHELEFTSDPSFPNYVASGTVDGSVKNQFSIDEDSGFVRVATTEDRLYLANDQIVSSQPNDPTTGAPPQYPGQVSNVFVLGVNGTSLDVVGAVPWIASNEQIQSVRFLGPRAYVVTFRRVDPLFVLDLSTPAQPKLLGAVEIPGFSEYMHPLDATHLLTIGKNADTSGRTTGLQLQIFDVADGTKPVLAQRFSYAAGEYGQSEAEYDHKAFTYFDDKKLLAFPYYAYGTTGMRSSLELFRVDLATGFTKLGSIDHTELMAKTPQGFCGGYYPPSVRRGVFLEDFVYSVSYGGVVVRDSRALAMPVAALPLPAPVSNQGYGPPACY